MYRLFWRLGNNVIVPGPEILDPWQMALKHSLVFMHQIRENQTCLDFNDFFILKEKNVTRSDNQEDVFIKRNRLQTRNAFFTTHIAKWYNKLPVEIKRIKTSGRFKTAVTEFVKNDSPTPPYVFLPWYNR